MSEGSNGMCGIAGIAKSANVIQPLDCSAVRSMTKYMHRRGPDAEGEWIGKGVMFGHRRLAILDPDPRANQPMTSQDGIYTLVFNGEIYNFRELRAGLESRGVRFRTSSDTEVLLELYARDQERILPQLRGMFAFAIWNAESRELFLARDPYGIKPLFYAQLDQCVIFASQVKALLASKLVEAAKEPAGVAGFFLYGSVPEPFTLFRNIFALPAGSWIRVRDGHADEPQVWYDIRRNWTDPQEEDVSVSDLQGEVRRAVSDSVKAHLVSDVPVSIFLSGGIDSGVVAGMASELGAKVEGITVGFDEFSSSHDDEAPVAATIAAHYGLRHHVRRVSREEFEGDLPLILEAMDQPSIDGVNTWFASKAVAERGYKVVLSGVGGDELLHGYSHARKIPTHARIGKAIAALPGSRALFSMVCRRWAESRSQPKARGIPEFMGSIEGMYFLRRGLFLPSELPDIIGQEMAREGLMRLGGWPPGITPSRVAHGSSAVCLLESTLYLRNQLLRDSDWASMAHSLELRTPLTDATLLARLKPHMTKLSHGTGKKLLAGSTEKPLPSAVVSRPKTGFGVPMAKWLQALSQEWNSSGTSRRVQPGTPWARQWALMIFDSITTPRSYRMVS